MKKYSLLFFLIFFCSFNPKISLAEPGFFLQTLTDSLVDWVFDRFDTYMEDTPDKSAIKLNEQSIQKAKKPSEKNVSIKMDEVVKRDDIFYKKFSNIPFSGHIESYHPNGQLKIIEDLFDGKKVGNWVEYYISGNKNQKVSFLMEKRTVTGYIIF